MKTINKIFMIIAMIILTPTVVLVAFILIADATDMDLTGIVADTEEAAGFLADMPAVPQNRTEAPVTETPVNDQISQEEAAANNLAATPPSNWEPTATNSALQRQLNTDAWVASPSSRPTVSGNSSEDTDWRTVNLPDADKYMKAYLDVVFKNNPSAYLQYKIGTAEDAADLYEESLDEETIEEILGSLGFDGAQAEERLDLMRRILANVRYEVVEAKKQDDGSYVVTVSYEKMNIYVPAVDAYIKKAENMIAAWNRAGEANRDVPSYESMNEQLIEAYTECLKEAYTNATYDPSQSATIRLHVVNGAYELNEEDATKFGSLIIDTDAAMDKLEKAVDGWNF